MKLIFIFLISFFGLQLKAQSLSGCGPQQIRAWTQSHGYICLKKMAQSPSDCVICQGICPNHNLNGSWFENFPSAIYQPNVMPWWAYQGNLYYPNLHYPGAWNPSGFYPGINASFYPGKGEVHALKPNIYVESIHEEKKFSFSFISKEELSFLATTPPLDQTNTWKGKIIHKDRFEIDDVHYDYLFYDIRLPKEKMQFERGLCATREETIKWMLKDLGEMKYPSIALQDFEEHWKNKIPDYPFYCIYPQYSKQLDEVLPVSIGLEQAHLTRSLYVLIPHKKEPDVDEPQLIPFPFLDSAEIRPSALIKYETMFKEWGVAFLGE
jgi:hypothetical protein